MGVGPQREVGELGCLLGAGLGQLGPAVADLAREQSREAVEVPLAVLVPDVGTLASHHDGDLVVRVVGTLAREVHPQVPLGTLAQGVVAVDGREAVFGVGHRVPHV